MGILLLIVLSWSVRSLGGAVRVEESKVERAGEGAGESAAKGSCEPLLRTRSHLGAGFTGKHCEHYRERMLAVLGVW